MIGFHKSFEIVNICGSISRKEIPNLRKIKQKIIIGMVGRATNQKGYRFFAEVAQQVKGDAEFLWIGGGEDAAVKVLESAGVKVTGWLSREQVISKVSDLDYYFHTAAWEGFPISVLEAAELRIPIILRSLPSFSLEGLHVLQSVDSAAYFIEGTLNNDKNIQKIFKENSDMIRKYHSRESLRRSLQDIYGIE